MNNAFIDSKDWNRERIISFRDQFSVGPILHLIDDAGMSNRFEWMKNKMIRDFEEHLIYMNHFQKAIRQILSVSSENVYVWVADNAHEQTGFRFVVHLLRNHPVDIIPIRTSELYQKMFSKKNRDWSILRTGEILPEQMHLMFENHSESYLTDLDKEALVNEWGELVESHETLRIWRNGRVHNEQEDYFDEVIIKLAKNLHRELKSKVFIKAPLLIGEILGHLDTLGEEFLEYRLKKMIEQGVFEVEGSLVDMRFYRVRLNG